jgi:hypothetical protein
MADISVAVDINDVASRNNGEMGKEEMLDLQGHWKVRSRSRSFWTSDPMRNTAPEIQDLARQLIAFEARSGGGHNSGLAPAIIVCDKLRVPLSKLSGLAAYTALLSRALTLAGTDVPALGALRVGDDGQLDGVEQFEQTAGPASTEAGFVLVAILLGLLALFIGEPLTLHLVRDIWPDASLEKKP